MEEKLEKRKNHMSGLAERFGGEGTIQWETKENKGTEIKKWLHFRNVSFIHLLVAICVISTIAELYFSKGSTVLIIGIIFASIFSLRAQKHDNIPMVLENEWVPFFGHFFLIFRRLHDFFDLETSVVLGMGSSKPVCAGIPLGRNFVFVTDPKSVDVLFRLQFGNAEKGTEVNTNLNPMLGNGIFASDGNIWKKHRAIASKMFTIRSLRDYMFEVFQDTTTTLINKFEELNVQEGHVDLYNMYNRLTLEAFTQVAFGVPLGCIKAAPLELQFATSFDRGFQICTLRFFDPTWKIKKLLNIGIEKELKKNLKAIDEFISKVITERKKQLSNKSMLAQRYDIISLFLTEDPNITDQELRDIAMNFIIAGRDTTAQLLSWFSYCLTQNPDVESKIIEEIKEFIPSHIPDNQINYDMVNKCQYLENALLETLRLRPSVPHLVRFAKVDIKLPDDYIIRKGDAVVVPTYAMGRLPWIWKDPLKFDPTRFENTTYTPNEYPAFNIPPRLCLGKHVALLEAKIAAVRILRKYKFKPLPNQNITYVFSVTNQMKDGFKVKLIQREDI